jgi:hypothetical protein
MRTRYRLIDQERLLESLGGLDPGTFRRSYAANVESALQRGQRRREAHWTEALAVGSQQFVQAIGQKYERQKLDYELTSNRDGHELWTVREVGGAYSAFSGGEKRT